MIFGPVLVVELITSSRRMRYYAARVIYAFALFVWLWIGYSEFLMPARQAGGELSLSDMAGVANFFFRGFAILQVVAVLILTPIIMAGAIAEERERRTLDYLLASDLGDAEIILNKFLARMVHAAGMLVVGVPILALTMFLGGVGPVEIAAVFVVTLSTLVVVGALSMWNSVHARRARDAVGRVFVLVGLLLLPGLPTLLPFLPWGFSAMIAPLDALLKEIDAANPLICVQAMFSGATVSHVGLLVRNQAIVACVCLIASVWQLRREERRAQARRSFVTLPRWLGWRPMMGDLPLLWKEMFAERSGRNLGVVGRVGQFVVFVVVIGTLGYFYHQAGDGSPNAVETLRIYIQLSATAIACVSLLVVAMRAAASCTSERERQTWDALLLTPLDAGEILVGKLGGSLYAVRGLAILLGILWTVGLISGGLQLWAVVAVIMEFTLLSVAAAVLGLAFSLRAKSSVRAMAATALVGAFAAGGYMFVCIPFVRNTVEEYVLVACIPFLLVFPAVVSAPSYVWGADDYRMLGIWIVGSTGYFTATIIILAGLLVRFDERAGRRPSVGGDEDWWRQSKRELMPVPDSMPEQPSRYEAT